MLNETTCAFRIVPKIQQEVDDNLQIFPIF